jgi:hypothetical protein
MPFSRGPYHVGGKDQTIVFDPDGWAIADAKSFHGRHEPGAAQDNARLLAESWSLMKALRAVDAAVLRRGDGKKLGVGWSITALNAARPLIEAALARIDGEGE